MSNIELLGRVFSAPLVTCAAGASTWLISRVGRPSQHFIQSLVVFRQFSVDLSKFSFLLCQFNRLLGYDSILLQSHFFLLTHLSSQFINLRLHVKELFLHGANTQLVVFVGVC